MLVSEETKIAVLETRVDSIDRNVTKVMENHLPHIQAEVSATNDKIESVRAELKADISNIKIEIAKWVGIITGAGIVANTIISKLIH